MSATEYQNRIKPLLKAKLNTLEVITEWTAFKGRNLQYSPRVDMAVGPFSIITGGNKIREFDNLVSRGKTKIFLETAFRYHKANLIRLGFNDIVVPDFAKLTTINSNARCLLAIEIENTSTRKHIMGSMVNAASLGRVGIGVSYNDKVLLKFAKILKYLQFLKGVDKNTYDTTNFLIVTKEQFSMMSN